MKRIASLPLLVILAMTIMACTSLAPSQSAIQATIGVGIAQTQTAMSSPESLATGTPMLTDTAIPIIAMTPDEQLFSNTSFEWDPQGYSPFWHFEQRGSDAVGEWSTQSAQTGGHSLSLMASTAGTLQHGWPGWVSFPISHIEGYGYHLTVMHYSPDGAEPFIEIEFYDRNGKFLRGMSPYGDREPPPPCWYLKERVVEPDEVPAGTSTLQIYLLQYMGRSEGRLTHLFYDDISVGIIKP